jgi:hypothetical protein
MSRLRPTDSEFALHWQRDSHRALLLRQWAARDGVGEGSDSEDDGDVYARGDFDIHGGASAALNELRRDASWASATGGCRADRDQDQAVGHSRPSSAVDRASLRRAAVPHGDCSFGTEATNPAGRRGGYPTPLTKWDRGMAGERTIQRPAGSSRPLFGPERHSAGVAAAAFLSSAAGAPPAGAKPTHHVPVPSSYVRNLIQAVRHTAIPAFPTRHHPLGALSSSSWARSSSSVSPGCALE